MKEMTAHDRFLERQRIANERAIEMGYGKAIEDAIVGGTGITKDNKRIDPADFYEEPKIGCVNHDCDKCKAVQEPVAWPCVIAEADFEQNTITLEMKCSDYKVGAGQHWLHTTPPAPQPVPVKTYHDGKPWPVAPKPWVGLTDADRKAAFESLPDMLDGFLKTWGWLHFSKAIEAKLKEKNHDH